MCMSVIQGVGMCGIKKTGFLCRNCVFLLKAYFVSQIPFLSQQNLKERVFLAVNPYFYECGFDGIEGVIPNFQTLLLPFSPATKYPTI